MPRVDAYKEKYLINDFTKAVKKKMATECTQAELAESFGVTQQGIGSRINRGKFMFSDLVKLFDILDFSNKEILKVMGR